MSDIQARGGTIDVKDYDSYLSIINGIPMAVQFYYIDKDLIVSSSYKCLKPITQSGFVMNLLYMPFLNSKDVDLYKIPYDQKNLGSVSDSSTDPEEGVYVYKLHYGKIYNKKIGQIKVYPDIKERPITKSHWNESKLLQYPYHYITINDYINEPLKLIPQFLSSEKTNVDVMVSQPLSITGGYTIYINGYKGDRNNGANEGLFAAAGLDLPTSGSQYAQFMATSKSSFLAENAAAARNETLAGYKTTANMVGSVVQSAVGIGKMTTGNVVGGMADFVSGGANFAGSLVDSFQADTNKQNRIEQSQATINDILSAPRNVALSSSDILMSIDRNQKQLVYNRYMLTATYRDKLVDYWTLYGYKQNRLLKNENNKLITSRKYFNYIKTIDANIVGDELDKTELEQIKNIYNSGVTFWHQFDLEQNGLKMYDYHMDNKERWKV